MSPDYRDDIRTFEALTRDGTPTLLAIRREHVVAWHPSIKLPGTTIAMLDGNRTFQLILPFKEFHAWVINLKPAPTLAARAA